MAGWTEDSGVAAADLARRMAAMGYEHLVYTDIARDGMQTGVENDAYAKMAAAFGNRSSSRRHCHRSDIRALAPIADAVEGVITGRAIYEAPWPTASRRATAPSICRSAGRGGAPLTIERVGKLASKEKQPGRRRMP